MGRRVHGRDVQGNFGRVEGRAVSIGVASIAVQLTAGWVALALFSLAPMPPGEIIAVHTAIIGLLWGEVLFS